MLDDIIELVLTVFADVILDTIHWKDVPKPVRKFFLVIFLVFLFGAGVVLIGMGIVNHEIALIVISVIVFILFVVMTGYAIWEHKY